MATGWRRALLLLALLAGIQAINLRFIAPHLGILKPASPLPSDHTRLGSASSSRDPSTARSRTPDSSDGVTVAQPMSRIRGGDTTDKLVKEPVSKVLRSPRARSESGIDSWEESSIFDAIGRHRFPSTPPELPFRVVVRFRVNYSTRWGENVVIVGSTEELGGMQKPSEAMARRAIAAGKGKVMRYVADGNWEFVTVLDSSPTEISYRYALVRERGEPLVEGGAVEGRLLDIDDVMKRGFGAMSDEDAMELGPVHVEVRDQWRVDRPHGEDVLLRTEAFKVMYGKGRVTTGPLNDHITPIVVKGPEKEGAKAANDKSPNDNVTSAIPDPEPINTRYRLIAERTRVPYGQSMAVECGELFGPVPQVMSAALFPTWELDVEIPDAALPVKYRYVVVDDNTGKVVDREAGALRVLGPALGGGMTRQNVDSASSDGHYVVLVKDEASTDRWPSEVSQTARVAGLSVSLLDLAGLRKGLGSVLDIKRLVDICVASGMHALHLESLCIGEQGQTVLSHAISVNYLSVSRLLPPGADTRIDSAPIPSKLLMLRRLFEARGKSDVESHAFADFLSSNGHWLKPYALFEAFKEQYNTTDTSKWANYSKLIPAQIDSFSSPGGPKYRRCGFWYWIQYHLHLQMSEMSAYARGLGVALMTDIPYASARDGADIWARPELFKPEKSLATMPTEENMLGSCSGEPAYDWARMKNRDGCAWWHGKVRCVANHFHGARLLDVVNFFRQWEVFNGCTTGLGGRQSPCNQISYQEMEAYGLWDRRRLCEPYVRERVLKKRFGDEWNGTIMTRFFDLYGSGVYRFKPGVDTEALLARNLTGDPVNVSGFTEKEVYNHMMWIMNERCILRDEKGPDDRFYPRLMMHRTDSFAEFGLDWQRKLTELHDSHFSWRQDGLFTQSAMEKIRILQAASPMLICADDSGPVPPCLPKVLSDMGVPGSRVPLREATPYLASASSPSGSKSVVSWYEGLDMEARKRRWQELGCDGEPPQQANVKLSLRMIQKVLSCDALLAWVPLGDLLALSKTDLNDSEVLLSTEQRSASLQGLEQHGKQEHEGFKKDDTGPLVELERNTKLLSTISSMVEKVGRKF